MKTNYAIAAPTVASLAFGLCGAPYASRAHAHRRQPHVKAVESTPREVPIKSDIKVYLDGKEMETVSQFDGQSTTPIVVDGQLLIPIRFVKEHLAKDLQLDGTWGVIEIQFGLLLKIGSKEWHGRADFGTDGLSIAVGELPVAPHEIRERIYIPVDSGPFQQMLLRFDWSPEQGTLRFTHRHKGIKLQSRN